MPGQQLTEKEKGDFMRQAMAGLITVPGEVFQRALAPSMAQTDVSVDMAPLKGLPARMGGKPTETDLELINRFAPSGQVDPESIYCYNVAPSTQRIDSHFTRMDLSSLNNYALEAMAGAPIMNSHKTGGFLSEAQLPLGRSFWGGVENAPDGIGKRFVSAAYMRRGSTSNGEVNTDSIIADMEAGIIGDHSIGFRLLPGTIENKFQDRSWLKCSICGQDWLSSDPWSDDPDDCQHWPGQVYKSDGGKQQELCYLDVMNGHLGEFSPCYSGSTPGAVILKAKRAVDSGRLNRSMVVQLEDTYRVRLADNATFSVPIIKARTEKPGEVEVEVQLNQGQDQGQERNNDLQNQDENKKPNEAERKEKQMADKREIEDAGKDGAKLALANLAKSIMSKRTFTDEELALFPEIETRLAAGELEAAQNLITRLMLNGSNDNQEGEGEDRADGDEMGGGNVTADGEDGSRAEEPDQPNHVSPTAIVSMGLTASERQQFQTAREENARLKREIAKMTPFAVLGEQRVAEVIEETMQSYSRAGLGAGEEIKDMLARMPYEQILNLRNQYETIADKLFRNPDGSTGRQTQAADPNSPAFAQGLVNNIVQASNGRQRNDTAGYR